MPKGFVATHEGGSVDTIRRARATKPAGTGRSRPVQCLMGVDPRRSHTIRDTVLGMPDTWTVHEAVHGLDVLRLGMSRPFDILVLDLQLPVIDGYSAAAEICAATDDSPAPPAVALVADSVRDVPISLSAEGMHVRILFRDSPRDLVHTALCWAADTTKEHAPTCAPPPSTPPSVHPGLAPSLPGHHASQVANQLSARERQVLVSLCLGQSNRQLAHELSVTESTVKTHVSRLLTKLGLASRVEAVVFAYENGIVVPGGQRRSA